MYRRISRERRYRKFTPVDIANGLIRVVPKVVGKAYGPLVGQPVGDIACACALLKYLKELEGM